MGSAGQEPTQGKEPESQLTNRPWQVVMLASPLIAVGAFVNLLAQFLASTPEEGPGLYRLLESGFALGAVLAVFFRFLPGNSWYRSQRCRAWEEQGISRSEWIDEVALVVQALLLACMAYGVHHIQLFSYFVIIFLTFDVLWLGLNTIQDMRVELTRTCQESWMGFVLKVSIPEFQKTAAKWFCNNTVTLLLAVGLVCWDLPASAMVTSLLLGFGNTAVDLISTRRDYYHYLSYFA